MKKLLIIASLFASIGFSESLQAQTTTKTVVVAPNTATNLFLGSRVINGVLVTAGATTITNVTFIDTPSLTNLTYIVPAYTNYVKYATNVVYTYTNYWGATTSLTNLGLAVLTNSVVSVTNSFPARFSASALANTTTVINNAQYVFQNGCLITNSASAGSATLTVTYSGLY